MGISGVFRAYSECSESSCAIFQKKGKEMSKKGKIFENLGRNLQYLKIFWKRAGDVTWPRGQMVMQYYGLMPLILSHHYTGPMSVFSENT